MIATAFITTLAASSSARSSIFAVLGLTSAATASAKYPASVRGFILSYAAIRLNVASPIIPAAAGLPVFRLWVVLSLRAICILSAPENIGSVSVVVPVVCISRGSVVFAISIIVVITSVIISPAVIVIVSENIAVTVLVPIIISFVASVVSVVVAIIVVSRIIGSAVIVITIHIPGADSSSIVVDVCIVDEIVVSNVVIVPPSSITIAGSAVIVPVAVVRTVSGGPPPATTTVTPPSTSNSYVQPTYIDVDTESPAIPTGITHVITPGAGSRKIIVAIPGTIIITGTENHRWSVYKGVQITRCIAHVYIIGIHVIDVHIFNMVNRVTGWNQHHFVGSFH